MSARATTAIWSSDLLHLDFVLDRGFRKAADTAKGGQLNAEQLSFTCDCLWPGRDIRLKSNNARYLAPGRYSASFLRGTEVNTHITRSSAAKSPKTGARRSQLRCCMVESSAIGAANSNR